MLVKLAESFPATNWGGAEDVMSPCDVLSYLDITEEQAVLLCATGFMRGVPASSSEVGVPIASLIAFLEEHGGWWFRLRAQKQIDRLKGIADPKFAAAAAAKATDAAQLQMGRALRDLYPHVVGTNPKAA